MTRLIIRLPLPCCWNDRTWHSYWLVRGSYAIGISVCYTYYSYSWPLSMVRWNLEINGAAFRSAKIGTQRLRIQHKCTRYHSVQHHVGRHIRSTHFHGPMTIPEEVFCPSAPNDISQKPLWTFAKPSNGQVSIIPRHPVTARVSGVLAAKAWKAPVSSCWWWMTTNMDDTTAWWHDDGVLTSVVSVQWVIVHLFWLVVWFVCWLVECSSGFSTSRSKILNPWHPESSKTINFRRTWHFIPSFAPFLNNVKRLWTSLRCSLRAMRIQESL